MKKENIIKKVAENLRSERARKKYSQDKLAEMAGITQKYLNLIENGKVNPSIVVIVNICEALNIKLNKIWDFKS